MKFWPTDAFRSGVASAIAVCVVFCGAAAYLVDLTWKLYDGQIAARDQQLSDMTTQAESLDSQLSALLDEKWREKYEAEHLQTVTLREEVSLINERYRAQIEELNARLETVESPDIAALVSNNAQLKNEKEVSEEKLRLANSELRQLREIHVESQSVHSTSGSADGNALQISAQNEFIVKRGQGWTSPDGVATFGVEGINFTRAIRGRSATYNADVKVFGESQKAEPGSTYSKEIDGNSYRISVTGISTTDQTVSIAYTSTKQGK